MIPLLASVLFIAVLLPHNSIAEREHKVHNIVLYPERHSWCQTQAIKQIVATDGYDPVTIDNNVCVGACFSYSIPRTQPAEPGELIGPYCDSCQPMETKCYHVTLKAQNSTKTKQKRVEIITNCSCSSCNKSPIEDCELSDRNTSELPLNLFAILNEERSRYNLVDNDDAPDLLQIDIHNQTHQPETNNAKSPLKYEVSTKVLSLLKKIQNEDEPFNRGELKELLKLIEGADNKLTDKNLMNFVNFININNSEDLELDLGRLKEVLERFQNQQELLERHRAFGLDGNSDNAKIEQDIKNVEAKYDLKNFGANAHHRHHLGEIQATENHHIGHLVPGPHGSLVLSEKLNLDSDEVRPNYEGEIISYDAHAKSKK